MSEVKEIEVPSLPKGLPWRDYKIGTVVKSLGDITPYYRIVTGRGLVDLHTGDVYTSGGLYEKVYGVTIVND
jgi:hypothetical protein